MPEKSKKNPKTLFDLAEPRSPDAKPLTGLTLEEALAQVDEYHDGDEELKEIIRSGYEHRVKPKEKS
jgi:hypothetical protein